LKEKEFYPLKRERKKEKEQKNIEGGKAACFLAFLCLGV